MAFEDRGSLSRISYLGFNHIPSAMAVFGVYCVSPVSFFRTNRGPRACGLFRSRSVMSHNVLPLTLGGGVGWGGGGELCLTYPPKNSYRDYAGGKRGNLHQIYFALFFFYVKRLKNFNHTTIEINVLAF